MTNVSHIITDDETAITVMRRHWIDAAPWLLAWAFLGAIGLIGVYASARYGVSIEAIGPAGMLSLAAGAVAALAAVLAYISWYIYRANLLVITDKHIYLVTQSSLFGRKVEQFGLEQLQEVSSTQNGILAHLFNFGDVLAETAGNEKNLHFTHAPSPTDTAEVIMQAHRNVKPSPAATPPPA